MTPPSPESIERAARNQWRRQFTLRELFADVAMCAVLFALLRFALSPYALPLGTIAILAATPISPAWIGIEAPPLWGADLPQRRRQFALSYATAAGAVISPMVIGIEWGSDHPWPASDGPYVLFAFLRCCLTGCAIGWIVATLFALAVGQPERFVVPSFRARKLIVVAPFVAALLALWLPIAPWYRQKQAIQAFSAAMKQGTSEEVALRVQDISWPGGRADVRALAWFQADNSPDPQVRIRALKALTLLGEMADVAKPSLEPLLDHENEGVRKAAAEFLGGRAEMEKR
jgi:hypothetical protein